MKNNSWGVLVWLPTLVLVLTSFAAWLTHIITCLSEDKWGFLVAGALTFPVAVVHGIGIWFGFWH